MPPLARSSRRFLVGGKSSAMFSLLSPAGICIVMCVTCVYVHNVSIHEHELGGCFDKNISQALACLSYAV